MNWASRSRSTVELVLALEERADEVDVEELSRTDAYRRIVLSDAASRSMSAMTIPWIESGSPSTDPALRAACEAPAGTTGSHHGAVARLARLVQEEQVLLSGRGDQLPRASDEKARAGTSGTAARRAAETVVSSRRLMQMSQGSSVIRSETARRI